MRGGGGTRHAGGPLAAAGVCSLIPRPQTSRLPLLARSSYDAVDDLDFISMEKFQVGGRGGGGLERSVRALEALAHGALAHRLGGGVGWGGGRGPSPLQGATYPPPPNAHRQSHTHMPHPRCTAGQLLEIPPIRGGELLGALQAAHFSRGRPAGPAGAVCMGLHGACMGPAWGLHGACMGLQALQVGGDKDKGRRPANPGPPCCHC